MAVISLYIVVFSELKTPLGGACYIHLTKEAKIYILSDETQPHSAGSLLFYYIFLRKSTTAGRISENFSSVRKTEGFSGKDVSEIS